jgi:hypothetical protein
MTELDQNSLMWGYMVQLSGNMWEDHSDVPEQAQQRCYNPLLQWSEDLWNDMLPRMEAAGVNMALIDLGDAIQYRSHPEIAVENAWSIDKLKTELSRLRELGIEPLPKLNFATTHDAWMGPYSRLVSTPKYYQVCHDLIAEVTELFDGPRFFHIGMDEETFQHQRAYQYVVVRQGALYWHDFHFYCDEVEKAGPRPWIWSDKYWHDPEDFVREMPASVLHSNWYYGTLFEDEPEERRQIQVGAYREFEKLGYQQLPTGSNHSSDENFGLTVAYGRQQIAPERLIGFLQTPWRRTIETVRDHQLNAIDQIGAARAKWEQA